MDAFIAFAELFDKYIEEVDIIGEEEKTTTISKFHNITIRTLTNIGFDKIIKLSKDIIIKRKEMLQFPLFHHLFSNTMDIVIMNLQDINAFNINANREYNKDKKLPMLNIEQHGSLKDIQNKLHSIINREYMGDAGVYNYVEQYYKEKEMYQQIDALKIELELSNSKNRSLAMEVNILKQHIQQLGKTINPVVEYDYTELEERISVFKQELLITARAFGRILRSRVDIPVAIAVAK